MDIFDMVCERQYNFDFDVAYAEDGVIELDFYDSTLSDDELSELLRTYNIFWVGGTVAVATLLSGDFLIGFINSTGTGIIFNSHQVYSNSTVNELVDLINLITKGE